MTFEGRFTDNRLLKGRVLLPNGDVLDGEWSSQGFNRRLLSGTLTNNGGEVLKKFSGRSAEDFELDDGNTLFSSHPQFGFAVLIKRHKDKGGVVRQNIMVNVGGTMSYEYEEGFKKLRYTLVLTSFMRYGKVEPVGAGQPAHYTLRFDYGAELAVDAAAESGTMTFARFKNVKVKGHVELQDSGFKLKGSIRLAKDGYSAPQRKIKISQSIVKPFCVKYDDSKFSSIKDFFALLEQLGEERSSQSPDVSVRPSAPKKDKTGINFSTSVLKKLIKTIEVKRSACCLSTDSSESS